MFFNEKNVRLKRMQSFVLGSQDIKVADHTNSIIFFLKQSTKSKMNSSVPKLSLSQGECLNCSAKLINPMINSTKPAIPMNAVPAEVAVVPEKIGFGYRGFGSASIRPVIPKHEIFRPTAAHKIKKIHPQDWNSSTKLPTGKATVIKPLPGIKKSLEDLKLKSFLARPVPQSHYNEPSPKLSSRSRQTGKKEEESYPGLASRIWHAVVDPILYPDNKPSDEGGIAQKKPVEKVIT